MSDNRFARQEGFFGAAGQKLISQTRVAIVGLGGTGSHIVQQLGYLGVKEFALVEFDVVDSTSCNRLVGATQEDAERRTRKIDVAERVLLAITPNALVERASAGLFSAEGFAIVRRADVVFSCVDRVHPRFVLNELCQAYELTLVDIATEIDPDNPLDFGGRMIFCADGERCLVCGGGIDQEEMRRELETDGQRADDEATYGVRKLALDGSGPSVVSLNGLLASVAVTEFMVHLTGLRAPRRSLEYRGAFGVLAIKTELPRPECPYCQGCLVRGQREKANVDRWITGLHQDV